MIWPLGGSKECVISFKEMVEHVSGGGGSGFEFETSQCHIAGTKGTRGRGLFRTTVPGCGAAAVERHLSPPAESRDSVLVLM